MDSFSPYDLIRRARRQASTGDRWAALLSSERVATPVEPTPSAETPSSAAPSQAEPQQTAAPSREAPPFPLRQPPFPPPQARNPILDAIAQRHEQAMRTAMPPMRWDKANAPARPRPAPAEAVPSQPPPSPPDAPSPKTPRDP